MARTPGRYPHGLAFLAVLLVSGGAVGAAYAAPPGRYPPADRVRASVDLLLARARGLGGAAAPAPGPAPADPAVAAPARTALRTVVRVVDGDTVVLDGNEKVRLIGIDTPESVDPRRPVQWYGKEAAAFTRRLLEGRRVRPEHDVERKDRYGRTLAYLLLEDGTFVNLRLVEEGYAFACPYPPNVRYADRFREAERAAREAGRGLWSEPAKAAGTRPSRGR